MDQSITALLERLESQNPEDRRSAAEALGECEPSSEIISALGKRLSDANKGVRDAVAHTLMKFKSTETARVIAHYISDDNVAVRNLAGEMLVQMGTDAIEAILPHLHAEDADDRKFAVDTLGLIQNPAVVGPIIGLLTDDNENVRYAVVEALGNIRDAGSVGTLMELFGKDDGLRAPISEALGKIGGDAAGDFLLRSITTEDTLVQFAIVEALGNLGTQQALYPLMERITEHTGEMRRVILRAIVGIIERQGMELRFPETFETYFIEALEDEEREIRLSALRGLSQFSTRRSYDAMLKLIGDDEEVNEVISSIFHENPREAFGAIIEKLEQEFEQSTPPLVQLLARVTKDIVDTRESNPDDDELLQRIDRAFDALLRMWGELTGEMRYGTLDLLLMLDGERALPIVRDALSDSEPWVRIHALELLEHIGDARIREHLETAVNDESEVVREFAQRSLERLTIPQ